MDLKQGGRSVHDYSKQFNHLAQYAPDQVDTDEKKDRFMLGLSTKLQERMVLNTGGTFPEFISNVMIVADAIRAHKETKKKKAVVAPSGSDPLKYRTVYHYGSTYPPQQPQQHRHQHQWAAPKPLPPPPPVMRLTAPLTAGAASIVVVNATLLRSEPRQRRMPLRATSPILHVVRRRWPLQRPVTSTTLPWRIFPMASKSSWVRFL
jgi:hypothetical protein